MPVALSYNTARKEVGSSIHPCKNLWFYPHGSKKGSRFESFREAWWLLSPELKETCAEQPA